MQKVSNNLPALKLWHHLSIRLSHLQTSQSTETVMLPKVVMWPVQPIMFGWWQNSSRCVYFASLGKIGVYILHHKIIATCEIIFFVYVVLRKKCTVMPFSYSLKTFGWRQNCSRSIYFASWGKIDTCLNNTKISALAIGKKIWKTLVSAHKKLISWALMSANRN